MGELEVPSSSRPLSTATMATDNSTQVDDGLKETRVDEAPAVATNEKSANKEEKFGSERSSLEKSRDASPHVEHETVAQQVIEKEAAEGLAEGADDEEREEDYEYPKAWRLTIITIALCLSVFCMALDNTIISTAIPKITDQFNSLDDVGWYASSYLLTTCAFQLFYGRCYSYFSIKWTYLVAIFIFEVGSAVCGAAPNSVALIVGRAIAGVGSAGIFSGAILIISYTVPLRQRSTYTGTIAGMYGIASVAGPLLGGAFTDKVSWRWCFYINLPIGAITAAFIIIFYQSPQRKQLANKSLKDKLKEFDFYGTAIFLPCIVCLLLALQWGGTKYAWGSGRIIALFVVFGLLLIAFVAVQLWRGEYATVPPRLLKQRSVLAGSFFISMLGGSFFVVLYYVPIWFQAIKGTTAEGSGIRNLPLVLSLVVVLIAGGGTVTAIGYYTPFMIASSIVMAVGAGLISTWHVNTLHPMWIGYQVIYGVGVGLGMQLSLIAVQTVLPKKDVPVGTAIVIFSQTLGGALFVSVAENVFENKLISGLKVVAPDVNAALVATTGATTLRDLFQGNDLTNVLVAYNSALSDTFYVAVALSALSIFGSAFMEWKSVKGVNLDPGAA